MANLSFFCEEHQVEWFKTANMRAYAHPVKDDDGLQVINEETGKPLWCNMVKTESKPRGAERSPSLSKVPVQSKPPTAPMRSQSAMTKDDWAEKDRVTRQSIHRQSASDRAVALAVGGVVPLNALIAWMKLFESYYDTGNTPPLGDLLVPSSSPPQGEGTTLCPIHNMPLLKSPKTGAWGHVWVDEANAKHTCTPKV